MAANGQQTLIARLAFLNNLNVGPPTPPMYEQNFGVNVNAGYFGDVDTINGLIALVPTLNCNCARDIIKWAAIQPDSADSYTWTYMDAIFAAYALYNITPIFTFATVPSWTAGYTSSEWNVPGPGSDFDTLVTQSATFITAFVTRYPQVQFIEFLNEPNQPYDWLPTPNVTQYIQWNNACRTAAIGAGFTGKWLSCCATGLIDGPTDPGIAGLNFITEFISGGGEYDAISIHPYPGGTGDPTVDNYPDDNSFDDISRVIGAVPDNTPIFVTEWGWSESSSSTIATYVTESSDMLNSTGGITGGVNYRAQIPYATIFCISDNVDANYGLYTTGNVLKLQGTAYKNFCASVGQ